MISQRNKDNLTQVYNDGTMKIFHKNKTNEEGAYPSSSYVQKYALCFAQRIVGIGRYWSARQNNVEISQVIRIPRLANISTEDVAVLEKQGQSGLIYEIKQIQHPESHPYSMDLSLQLIQQKFHLIGKELILE